VAAQFIPQALRALFRWLVRYLLAEPLMSDLIRIIDLNYERRIVMARYVLTKAFWTGQQRLRAGRIIAQTQGEAQPSDVVWNGTLPDGAVPVGSVPPGTAYLGVDSVD